MIRGVGSLGEYRSRDGYERWRSWTEWPLVGLGLLFLAVLILPLAQPLTPAEESILEGANLVIWALFVVDYGARLYLVDDRRSFVRTHILDLVVIAVPFLRPFRLLRLLAIVISTSRRAGGLAVRRVTLYVTGVAVILLSVGAVVVYDSEKEVPLDERTIKTLGDGLWWALVTVTTVGYGDVYPRSVAGRGLAVLLTITGIALIGTITAAISSYFVNIVRTAQTATITDDDAEDRAELLDRVRALALSVDALREEVRALRAPQPDDAHGP
jgi:voltage-gated potassium channel